MKDKQIFVELNVCPTKLSRIFYNNKAVTNFQTNKREMLTVL